MLAKPLASEARRRAPTWCRPALVPTWQHKPPTGAAASTCAPGLSAGPRLPRGAPGSAGGLTPAPADCHPTPGLPSLDKQSLFPQPPGSLERKPDILGACLPAELEKYNLMRKITFFWETNSKWNTNRVVINIILFVFNSLIFICLSCLQSYHLKLKNLQKEQITYFLLEGFFANPPASCCA